MASSFEAKQDTVYWSNKYVTNSVCIQLSKAKQEFMHRWGTGADLE
jgi:hypothetical protein